MPTYAAFLRGINLGARNKVSMPELNALLVELGLEDVATYVQSGNVVFRTRAGKRDELARRIERAIATKFGVDAAVILRTAAELRTVATSNPFERDETDATKLLVVFLDGAPSAKAKQLDPERGAPGRFAVLSREIYLHVPDGFGRSKLTLDYFERRLGVKGTVRNWRTVKNVLALTEGSS